MPSLFKIVCLSINEREFIEDWLLYHGYLAGYENIILVDNMSTDKHVLEVYEKYKHKGIKFHTFSSYHGNEQSVITSKYMNMYKNDCEFILALDTDEFLYSIKHLHEGKDPTLRENVIEAFKSIPADVTYCHIGDFPQSEVDTTNPFYRNFMTARPARNMTFFSKDPSKSKVTYWYHKCEKSFARSSAFKKISNGNHAIYVDSGKESFVPIGYLHFHSTGSRDILERAKNTVYGQRYVDRNDSLETMLNSIIKADGPGHHRVWQFADFKTKEFICRLYIEYKKRLPLIGELFPLTNALRNKPSATMRSTIQALGIVDGPTPTVSEEEIDALVFYEEPLDMENIVEYKWLAERLSNLTD